MADKQVQIQITAKTDEAVVGIGKVNQELAATGGKATEAGKGLGQVGQGAEVASSGLGKARQGVQSISQSLSAAKSQLVAFISAQLGLSAVRDVARTADAYNNLQGRIKLATGEGAAFTAAFGDVAEISRRTSSNLEQTGQLFAKVAEAGKSAGLSTQQAISQALGLTETINQAIQLSGGSAESAKAAVTQLVQGFQSGVLRGDEFNSVMEQSPRLAKALADGLGVTTGELRKMAEAGTLSSDTVMSALKGQADTLKREFATLPPTVGRALENLSTSWTLYVGETDKATGASAAAAGAISALAANLSTVAGLLMDAGQAAAAFTALRLAQTFIGIGAAATQATAAVAANTAAVNAAGAAGMGAAAGVGRFASILSGLKTFTLLGLITNFQDIGTAIGEGIAKLAGYKDRSDEIARIDRTNSEIAKQAALDRQKLAAMTQAAIDKQFELSKGAQAAIAVFDGLRAKGESAAEAVGKIGKDFDLSGLQGIRDFSAVLDKLAADGKIAAGEFRQAWADALKGQDLAVFETQARAAFAGTAREAERVAQLLDASVREAVRRTGLDMDLISGGMGRAARSAINDTEAIIKGLDRLKAMGVDTGQALAASLTKGIDTADSQRALDAVKAQIEAVRKSLGDKVADGLLDQAKQKALELRDAMDKATPGINSVREAMKALGVTSDETLRNTAAQSKAAYDTLAQSGKASARELSAAFQKYASDAIAANNGVATESIKTEAAMRGLEITTDSAGKSIVRAMGSGADAAKALGSAVGLTTEQIRAQEDALDRVAMKYKLTADYTERQIALLEREAALMERMDTLERKRQGVDKNGFATDKSGNTVAAGGDLTTLTGIAAFLKAAGVDDDKAARDIAREFADAKGDIPYFSNPGQMKYGGANSTMSQAVLKAAERYTFGSGSPVGASVGAPRPSTIPEQTRTVNINLNGQALGTVRTDAAGDATLQRLLDELGRAKAAAQG